MGCLVGSVLKVLPQTFWWLLEENVFFTRTWTMIKKLCSKCWKCWLNTRVTLNKEMKRGVKVTCCFKIKFELVSAAAHFIINLNGTFFWGPFWLRPVWKYAMWFPTQHQSFLRRGIYFCYICIDLNKLEVNYLMEVNVLYINADIKLFFHSGAQKLKDERTRRNWRQPKDQTAPT